MENVLCSEEIFSVIRYLPGEDKECIWKYVSNRDFPNIDMETFDTYRSCYIK